MVFQATGPLTDVIQAAVDELDQSAILVNPSTDTITAVIDAATGRDDLPTIRILASEDNLKQIQRQFTVASRAADLVEAGQLELRTKTENPDNQVIVTETGAAAIVNAGKTAAILPADEEDFVTPANQYYSSMWSDAEEFSLRTPPLSRIRETLQDEFGRAFLDDFDTMFESIMRDDEIEFDKVDLFLLLTARHEELLYDIGRWAEDIGVASKATFSRNKAELEDHGLIDSEKVPIEIGRPRLRLILASEQLRTADADQHLPQAERLKS